VLVAPAVVVSTVSLFASGVALLAIDHGGRLVALHKASVLVWLGAMSLHVLTRTPALARTLRRRTPGLAVRMGVAGASLLAGVVLATATLPAVDEVQDGVSAHVGAR
jgi:hypothetical protein